MASQKKGLKKYQQDVEEYQINDKSDEDRALYGRAQGEEYDQYIQDKNNDKDFYYDANQYEEDEDEENDQNNHNSQDGDEQQEKFEDIPNIKKILQPKNPPPQETKQQQKQVQKQEEKKEEQEEEEEEQEQQDEDNQNEGEEQENYEGQDQQDEQEREQYEEQEEEEQYAKQQYQKQLLIEEQKKQTSYKGTQSKANEAKSQTKEPTNAQKKSNTSSNTNSTYQRSTKSFETRNSIKEEERKNANISEPFDSVYDSKKNPYGLAEDPELEKERKSLWKAFGRDCPAGRELFSLYKCHQPVKMNYPKIIKKSPQELLPKIKEVKPCPQKTEIEYPPLSYKEPVQKFFKVDFIPKRKPEHEIRKELDELKKNPYVPINRGKDRKDLINKLQTKFKNMRGALPKGAELPQIDENTMIFNEEMITTQASKRIGLKNKMFEHRQKEDDNKTTISEDPVAECNQLFDQILAEIEERQEYLDSISHLKEAELKKKIKQEIVERVAELQKVTEIKKKYLK